MLHTGRSTSVQLISSLTGLDLTKLVYLFNIELSSFQLETEVVIILCNKIERELILKDHCGAQTTVSIISRYKVNNSFKK